MAVLPINSVSVNANQYTFTGKKDKNSHKANPLASVPVIVMLAMAPMAEGKQPAQFMPIDSEHLTEVLAQANSVAPKAYEYTQSNNANNSEGINSIAKRYKIQEIVPAIGNGKKAKLVFCDYASRHKDNKTSDLVSEVYYVPNDYKPIDIYTLPPEVITLVYHDLGPGKEFCGIIVSEKIGEKNQTKQTIKYEIRLDDKSAQKLIDLIAGDSKLKSEGFISFSETKSPQLKTPKDF